jgi:hypothetical protein
MAKGKTAILGECDLLQVSSFGRQPQKKYFAL